MCAHFWFIVQVCDAATLGKKNAQINHQKFKIKTKRILRTTVKFAEAFVSL